MRKNMGIILQKLFHRIPVPRQKKRYSCHFSEGAILAENIQKTTSNLATLVYEQKTLLGLMKLF